MNKTDIYFQTYLNLERELLNLSKYIYITDVKFSNGSEDGIDKKQLETYSPYIADLIIRSGVEIEALSKSLYLDNGGIAPNIDSDLYFDTDCLKYLHDKWNFDNKEVLVVAQNFYLKDEENYILTPLSKSYKRNKTIWKKSYQALKHNRYAHIKKASVECLIHSLAALYLLNIYNKHINIQTNFNDIKIRDYSFGSNVFSVRPPQVTQDWDGNLPIPSESPFIATMQDSYHKKIEKLRSDEYDAMIQFINSQPEINDPDFIKIIEGHRTLIDEPVIINTWFVELGKFRLKKNLNKYSDFSDKKYALLNSIEYNGWINQHNERLDPDYLNEYNIDSEIERVGSRWGIQLFKKYFNNELLRMIFNDNIYEIKIPK